MGVGVVVVWTCCVLKMGETGRHLSMTVYCGEGANGEAGFKAREERRDI